jgi:hypothetical protein
VDVNTAVVSDRRMFFEGQLESLNKALRAMKFRGDFGTSLSDIITLRTYPRGQSAQGASVSTQVIKVATCPTGQYLDPGVGVCRPCLAGTYSDENGLSACKFCPVGTSQALQSSRQCLPCAQGTEAPVEGMSRCTVCQAGRYRGNATDATCLPCPQGSYSSTTGATVCTACEPGSYNTGSGFSTCLECAAGSFAPGGSGLCLSCPAGAITEKPASASCQPCPAGWHQPDIGQRKCIECAVDTYSEFAGNRTCTPCSSADKSTRGKTGSASELSCECIAGTYGPPGPGACTPCPRGGLCADGTVVPVVRQGFWRDEAINDDQMFQCIPAHACPGSTNTTRGDECALGYTGFRCGQCLRTADEIYYRLGDECVICPKSTGWSMLLLFLLFCLVAGLVMVFGRTGVRFGTVQIGINFFQMLSLFGGFRLSWPPVVVDFFGWMGIFAFNVEVLHPECEVEMSYFHKTALILSLPFFFLALFCAVFGVYSIVDRVLLKRELSKNGIEPDSVEHRDAKIRRRDAKRRMLWLCIASFMILISVLYAALSTRSLAFFDCTLQHNGKYMMDASPTDECYDAHWYKYLWVGVTGTLIYVIAYPAGLGIAVSRARHDVHVRNIVVQVLSPLLSNYRNKYLGWELAIIARKAVIIMASLYFTETALYQAVGGLIVLIFALILHAHGKPFLETGNNIAEGVSLLCALLILVFGLIVYPGQPTEEETTHIGYIVIGLAVIAMLTLLAAMLSEVKSAWTTVRRAVDFRRYTSSENVLCLRRIVNTASESRVRDWLQHSYEGRREGLHDNLWALLRTMSVEVMKFNAEKAAVKRGGNDSERELAEAAAAGSAASGRSQAALRLRQLLFSGRAAQKHLTSTHLLESNCGGMLQESAVPAIREWLRSRAALIERGAAKADDVLEFQNFVVTFSSIELHHHRSNIASKDMWHAEQEAKAAAQRAFRVLEQTQESGGGELLDDSDDEGRGGGAMRRQASHLRAGIVDLAPVDRAVTSLLVPLLYGPFGSAWMATMADITDSEELSSISLYRQTLHDLQLAYLSQLVVNADYTPSMRFAAALPKRWRRVVSQSAITASDNLHEEVDDTGESRDEDHGKSRASAVRLRKGSTADVLADIGEQESSLTTTAEDEDVSKDVATVVSILGIDIPSWPFFGGPTRTPPALASRDATDDESDDDDDDDDQLVTARKAKRRTSNAI